MKVAKGCGLICWLLICQQAYSQSLVQPIDKFGYVDWGKFVVRATGVGAFKDTGPAREQRVEALEDAKQAAQKNLLKAINGLILNASAHVSGAVGRSVQARALLANIASKFTIVDTRSMSDMSIEVEIELPITGELSNILLPRGASQGELHLSDVLLCPTCWQPWPERRPVPRGITLINPREGFRAPDGRPYTGLVIDARGLGLNPAINPKVVDESGTEIYGIHFVDRQTAVENGLVVYTNDLKAAFNDRRAGKEPLFIKAVRSAGELKADVVIANNEAVLVHSAAHVKNFLRRCRVILII